MPKPVLSDSLFNADDVATAILQEANLQIANNDLGVLNITNKFTIGSGFNTYIPNNCFHFMGFVFFNLSGYKGSSPSHQDVIYTINDSDYFPHALYTTNLRDYQGDTAERIDIQTSGNIILSNPDNQGNNTFYFNIQGFYRTNAGN